MSGQEALLRDLVLLRANLDKLSRVPSDIAKDGARGIQNQITMDTSSGLDCYGQPFAALKPSTLAKGRRPPPMVATGKSLDETHVSPLRGAGIGITLGGAFKHHLRRTPNRAARQVAPVRAGLPASWKRRLDAARDLRIRRTMGAQ